MKTYIVDEEFGSVCVYRSERLKSVKVLFTKEWSVMIKMPLYYDEGLAFDFFEKCRPKIREMMEVKKQKESRGEIYDNEHPFVSKTFQTTFRGYERNEFRGHINKENGVLTILHPSDANLQTGDSQASIRFIIKRALLAEAKRVLPDWLAMVSKRIGLPYKDCRILSMRTQWGSCSSKKSIHLSPMLLVLPDELAEFVMIHELCHTVEMNHSEAFHRLVNRFTDGKELHLHEKLRSFKSSL